MYLDPSFAGMLVAVIISIATVGGVIWYSAKRKARQLLKKDDTTTSTRIHDGENNEEMVDTLEDE